MVGAYGASPEYRSFAHIYWIVWFVCLVAFALSNQLTGLHSTLPYFLLISGTFGGYVFNFEFGRYTGFLRANYSAHIAAMERRFLFNVFPILHVALWKEVLSNPQLLPQQHAQALLTFRAAVAFSGVALVTPLALLPLYFMSYANVT